MGSTPDDILFELCGADGSSRLDDMLAELSTGKMIDAVELARKLNRRIIGQEAAIQSICTTIRNRLAKSASARKRVACCVLLAGPAGTGKTEFALALAEALHGDEKTLVTLVGGSLNGDHHVASLYGQVQGYGAKGIGILPEAIRARGDAVVLVDEMEKMSRAVLTSLLQPLSAGVVVSTADNSKYDCTQSIWIMTTNQYAKEVAALAQTITDPKQLSDAVKKQLDTFPPELLSRVDLAVPFLKLGARDTCKIIAINLKKSVESYEMKCESIEPEILRDIVSSAMARGLDARAVIGEVQLAVDDQLVDLSEAGAKRVRLRAVDGAVVAERM